MVATSRNIIAPAVYVLADFYGLLQIAFSLFLLRRGKKRRPQQSGASFSLPPFLNSDLSQGHRCLRLSLFTHMEEAAGLSGRTRALDRHIEDKCHYRNQAKA